MPARITDTGRGGPELTGVQAWRAWTAGPEVPGQITNRVRTLARAARNEGIGTNGPSSGVSCSSRRGR